MFGYSILKINSVEYKELNREEYFLKFWLLKLKICRIKKGKKWKVESNFEGFKNILWVCIVLS